MKLKKTKKKILAAVASALCFAAMMSTSAYASGDVAGAVQSTWSTARSQVVSVVNNVVFPVIDVILAVLLFVKIGMLYMDYRKHGQIEWTPAAILFGCLIFTLTAPLYIWSIVPQAVIIIAIAAENIAEYFFFIHKFSFLND